MSISGISNPYGFATVGQPGPQSFGNFGAGGAPTPGVEWGPTGQMAQLAGQLMNDATPLQQVRVENDAFDPIVAKFLCPTFSPEEDERNLDIMPEMLVFAAKRMDNEFGTQSLMSLPQLNQIMAEAYTNFRNYATQGEPKAARFMQLLEKYGERGLEDYVNAKNNGKARLALIPEESRGELKEFESLATQDCFRYLTCYGIMSLWTFTGGVLTVGRAISMDDGDDYTDIDHVLSVAVGVAKRVRLANVFGPADQITPGAQVCLILKRGQNSSGKPGPFCFHPWGTKDRARPTRQETLYMDESGHMRSGKIIQVGKVMESGRNASAVAQQMASNTGRPIGAMEAYKAHGTLPSIYVAIGYKH